MTYTITEAKANWDSLLCRAEQGQAQVITRRGIEVAVVMSIDDSNESVHNQELEITSVAGSRHGNPADED